MGNFSEHEARYRRREILAILAADTDYTCNEALLRTMLTERGYAASADRLRTDLAWLAEQGFVRLRELGDLQIATALAAGVDVATGAATAPGVPRPDPGRA